MGIRENIQIYHQFDIDQYVEVLKAEYGVQDHPDKTGALLLNDLPFYTPQASNEKDYVFILGFNYLPLPHVLIQALIEHPELAPSTTFIRWTAEQDLVMEGNLEELQKRLEEDESGEA